MFLSKVNSYLNNLNLHFIFQILIILIFILFQRESNAQNPIITHIRTADPSAQIWNDGKVWVYTSHDQDWATNYNSMDGYHVFSSYDLVNWTDHGEILHSRDVDWGIPEGGFMFAPDAAYKNGTYYLYFPHMAAGWNWRVGVATSDIPEGPFTDIGHFIEGTDHIDPTCFVDDDGQAYLIWGGDSNPPKIAKLNENMTELAEEPRIIAYGSDNFGEGPYMHKRNGIYYFSYTCHTCSPYQGYYAMGDNPYGPFEYKGELNLSPPGAQDHHSMIEYHGQWYYFYHVGNYGDNGSLYRRNVCVDSLFYNEDGTMQIVVQTTAGVGPDTIGMTPGIIIPGRIEAENFFRQNGINTLQINDSVVVTNTNNADWFDFVLEVLGSEEYLVEIKVSNPVVGSNIFLMVDELIRDTISVDSDIDTLETSIFLYNGKHTLKFLFSNSETESNLMNVDWIDLYGETNYHTILASATEGGSINPSGTIYTAHGDSAKFEFDWNVNYMPDSILIDGVNHSPSDSYTFYEVSEDHTIEGRFAECAGTTLIPHIQVNSDDSIDTSVITVTEGDDLRLFVEYEDSGILSWIDPFGEISTQGELEINNIETYQEGIYTVIFINSTRCKSNLDFDIAVNNLVLDVYQAEDWTSQSGVQTEGTSDAGGGLNVGWIDNNDWCEYSITFEESGEYEIFSRVATATNGGTIEIRIDGNLIANISVSGAESNGWQDWYTTTPVNAIIESGTHEVRLTFKGGSGYLFNINWFDMNWIDPMGIELENESNVPRRVELYPVYPNPFNLSALIEFQIDKSYDTSLKIYNMLGQNIKTLIDETRSAGKYQIQWDGKNGLGKTVSSGIYFVRLETDNDVFSRKFLLTK